MLTLKEAIEISVFKSKKRYLIGEELHIPISKPMWDRLLGQRERIKALHLTDFDVYSGLLQHHNRNSSPQFSFMARISNFSVISRGIATQGGIVYECTGYPVIHAGSDIYTEVDKDGMRWVPIYNLMGDSIDKAEDIKYDIDQMLFKKFRDIAGRDDHITRKLCEYAGDQSKSKKVSVPKALISMELPHGYFTDEEISTLGKLQYEMVKEFMEQIEVILRKYLPDIKKSLEDRFVIKGDGPTVALWDEVILNNVEIENAYFIRSITNNLLDSPPSYFLKGPDISAEDKINKAEDDIKRTIGKSVKYVDDNEIPRIFGEYLDKGEGLVKESYEQQLEDYVGNLQESWVDFGKGIIAAHLANWGMGEVQKFISGSGIGKKAVKLINTKLQLDLNDWRSVLVDASSKEKLEIAEKCKDINMLYHMAFNWHPFNSDIKMIRRTLVKNPQFVHQLKLKLLQHIAPFDVHSKKRIYKHPVEYDSTLEKKLKKSVF